MNSIQSTLPIIRNSHEYILKDSQEITPDIQTEPKRPLDNFDDIMDRTKKIIENSYKVRESYVEHKIEIKLDDEDASQNNKNNKEDDELVY